MFGNEIFPNQFLGPKKKLIVCFGNKKLSCFRMDPILRKHLWTQENRFICQRGVTMVFTFKLNYFAMFLTHIEISFSFQLEPRKRMCFLSLEIYLRQS